MLTNLLPDTRTSAADGAAHHIPSLQQANISCLSPTLSSVGQPPRRLPGGGGPTASAGAAPRLSRVPGERSRLVNFDDPVPSVSIAYRLAKRTLDIVMAVTFGLAVAPFLPLLAIVIKLDSRGPVFYSQIRIGHNERLFRIYKFRSMTVDAERHGAIWARESDPRVTRVGRFLRRSRADELPQLWNVLRGDMAFVGPRPERPEFTCVLEARLPAYRGRHQVKPGLTGWAQVRYRYASSVQDSAIKLDHDLYYVRHRSFGFDIKILALTVPVVLNLRGH